MATRVDVLHLADLLRAGIRVAKLIPDGADKPLPDIPNEVKFSSEDDDRALTAWDDDAELAAEFGDDYAGLLHCEVVTDDE